VLFCVFLENDKTDLRLFSGFSRRKHLFITTFIEKHCTRPVSIKTFLCYHCSKTKLSQWRNKGWGQTVVGDASIPFAVILNVLLSRNLDQICLKSIIVWKKLSIPVGG